MLDTLVRNGKVIDGSGAPYLSIDVGIAGSEIVYMGKGGAPEAAQVIDAKGKIVCPGFIDIHTHADTAVMRWPQREAKIPQGITTEVFSNCGGGVAPVNEKGRRHLMEFDSKGVKTLGFDWLSVAEYFAHIPPAATNTAYLVPHGALRVSAMGYDARYATDDEIAVMKALLEEGMADGAFGMSTGLAYVPMSSCDTREVADLSKVVARCGGFLADHMRNYREKVKESVDETIQIARESDVPIELSHYQAYGVINWGRGEELGRWIAGARDQGCDITFDSYPYDFSSGGFRSTIPAKYQEGGAEALVERLKDPAVRQALRHEIGTITTYDLNRLVIIGVKHPDLKQFVGRRLPDCAKEHGKDNVDFLCDCIIKDLGVNHINYQGNADDVKILAQSPYQMVGSDAGDAPKGTSKPHPRNYGTFPRFLRLFVKEEQALTWEQAVYKMSGFPAWRLGLYRRGILKPGFAADVLVIDPETVTDRNTTIDPEIESDGIDWMIVNGQIEIAEGKITGRLGGRVLKRGKD